MLSKVVESFKGKSLINPSVIHSVNGPSFSKVGVFPFLEKINIGRIYPSAAFMEQSKVIFLHLYQLVIDPTLLRRRANIFPGFWTVEIPVSSQLYISFNRNLYYSISPFSSL